MYGWSPWNMRLAQAQSGIPTVQVKKEMIERRVPLQYQGNAGSTAENALDVDNMLV